MPPTDAAREGLLKKNIGRSRRGYRTRRHSGLTPVCAFARSPHAQSGGDAARALLRLRLRFERVTMLSLGPFRSDIAHLSLPHWGDAASLIEKQKVAVAAWLTWLYLPQRKLHQQPSLNTGKGSLRPALGSKISSWPRKW